MCSGCFVAIYHFAISTVHWIHWMVESICLHHQIIAPGRHFFLSIYHWNLWVLIVNFDAFFFIRTCFFLCRRRCWIFFFSLISFLLFFKISFYILTIVRHRQWNGGSFDSQMYEMFNNLLIRSHFYLFQFTFPFNLNDINFWKIQCIELNFVCTCVCMCMYVYLSVIYGVRWCHKSHSSCHSVFFSIYLMNSVLMILPYNYTEHKNAIICFLNSLSLLSNFLFSFLLRCLNICL